MTAFDFSLVKNTSFAFDATADSLNMGAVDASTLTVTTSGSDLILGDGTDTVTLTGASLAQLTTSNLTFGTATDAPALLVGDNNTGAVLDGSGNTITTAATNYNNSNNQVFGLGSGDTITVGNGDNLIFGGSGIADSSDGNDVIALGTGGNTIYANAGNDTVTIAAPSAAGKTNTVFLGSGNDSIGDAVAHVGNFVVYGGLGVDTVNLGTAGTHSLGDATIYGGNGAADTSDGGDTINYGGGNVTIYSNAGNDSVTYNSTASTTANIFTGQGNDTVVSGTGTTATKAVIYGGLGTDSITNTAFLGDATIYGGNGLADTADGADTIVSGTGNSVIYGNAGNDSITVSALAAAANTASVHGGAGDDTIISSSATADNIAVIFTGGAGNDVYQINNAAGAGFEWDYTITDFASGDVFNVTLDGTTAASLSVSSLGSSPTVTDTNEGSYTFQGYAGDFSATNFVTSDGSLLLTNYSGTAASLTGGTGADLLASGSTGDTLIGGGSTAGTYDKLIGNDGDDTFQLHSAVAGDLENGGTVTGGNGTDTLEITSTTAAAIVDNDFVANNVTSLEVIKVNNVTGASVTLAAKAMVAGVTTVDGSALTGTNTLTVTATAFTNALTVTGGAGVDTVNRGTAAGNDVISTAGGADVLTIGAGNDSVDAGAGNDSITLTNANFDSSDTIIGGTGTDTIAISDTAAVVDADFTNVTTTEILDVATNAAHSATVGTLANAAGLTTVDFSGTTTASTIDASATTSGLILKGTTGADTITGGTGNDTITANSGADENDQLTGGTGSDTYNFLFAEKSADGNFADASTVDILDFAFGSGGDVVDITDLNIATHLRDGTGDETGIVVANSTTTGFAATDALYVATNTFAATEAGVVAALSHANFAALADGEDMFILFSDATNGYLAYITAAGGNGFESVGDSLTYVAEFSGITDFSSYTDTDIANNFADFVA